MVGLLLGLAIACKIAAVVAVAAIVVGMVVDRRRRGELRALVAVLALAGAALLGPFLLVAPRSFFRQVVEAQADRERVAGSAFRLVQTYWFARSATPPRSPS